MIPHHSCRLLSVVIFLSAATLSMAQRPVRPDAFPPVDEPLPATKSLQMASSPADMADWQHYPTYECYVEMMQQYAQQFPLLCRLDTIGTSVEGRLLLCLAISGTSTPVVDKREVFYSSTIHGDELVGFHLMLHLIDTLLHAYGTSDHITSILNNTTVYINPLSNPDGTYHGSNNTVQFSRRYNAHGIDLNRNYPDPFATTAKSIEPENAAMIEYVTRHHFRLAANLHSGSEVMNYPWDSFTSWQQAHPHADWWEEVCRRFVDTCRITRPTLFTDVIPSGYIAGGDWYVISGGRQDYMNYYHDILELTMELSSTKKLPSEQLPLYWAGERQALLNFINEVHLLPADDVSLDASADVIWRVYPNPTRGTVTIETPEGQWQADLTHRAAGIYLLPIGNRWVRVVKL